MKPLLSRHLWDLPKCPLNRGCLCLIGVVKIVQCLLVINIQWLLCTVKKLLVVKEAIQSSSSLPFITNFNYLFVNAKTLTDFSTYNFQGRNPVLLFSIQSGVHLIWVFNNRNQPNTTYFSVHVH